MPGLVVNKINRDFLTQFASRLKHGSILVTGTNGKTTTVGLLADIFDRAGYEVVVNRTGSNLSRGLISEFLDMVDWQGRVMADLAVLEVDEADLKNLLFELKTKTLLVTNLFRDQLDRYGELDSLQKLILTAVDDMPAGSKLVLNADDPLVYNLAESKNKGVEKVFFGLDVNKSEKISQTVLDVEKCVKCGNVLKYSGYFLAHLGDYRCDKCGFKRPILDYKVVDYDINSLDRIKIAIEAKGELMPLLVTNLPGLYNVYNVAGAVAVARAWGVENELIFESLQKFKPVFGRFEKLSVNNKNEMYLMLSKNPTGFNQLLDTVLTIESKLNLIFILNDNYADGRDVSWIWDVDFEKLDGRLNWLVVSGLRARDMIVRMKYAGVDEKIMAHESNMAVLIDDLIDMREEGTIFVMASYTGMMEFRSVLVKKGFLKEYWKEKK